MCLLLKAILILSEMTNFKLFKTERVLSFMKMAESSPEGYKTLVNGEIALYEQFLLFPQCFQKTCTADT